MVNYLSGGVFMKYTMWRRLRDSNNVSLSAKYDKGFSRVLVTVFSFIFIVMCILSSAAVIDYSARDRYFGNIANAQDSIEYDEDVYDEEADAEKQAEEARKKREEDAEAAREDLKEAYNKYIEGLEDDDDEDSEGNLLVKIAEKAEREKEDPEIITFGTVMRRILSVGYMNRTPEASNHNEDKGVNCKPTHPMSGTVMYHNCDVPNLLTQFLQSTIASFVQFGAINAEEQSAHVTNAAFGMPDNIPGGGAPVLPRDRIEKYTGLELFGYSFRFTSYKGEWDDIRVQNAARSLSGMGGFDRIKATFKAVASGIGNASKVAATQAASALSSGNVWGAITGWATGWLEGGFSGTINSILDTSDQNVFNQNAWYRVNFANTMYNARELSQEEIATELQKLLVEYMTGIASKDVEIPEELKSIKEPPLPPEDEISYCNYAPLQAEGVTEPPGITREGCHALYLEAVAASGGLPVMPMKWVVDGTRKQEPLTTYRSDYPQVRNGDEPDYFDIAMRLGVKCVPDDTQENWDTKGPKHSDAQRAGRKEYYNQIASCWAEGWQEAVDNKLKVDQNAQTAESLRKSFEAEEFQKWLSEDPQNRNYNAPWRRYVCVDDEGKDIRTASNDFVFLYDMKGKKNPACSRVRSPIQDGIFGNGYGKDYKPFLNDTRNLTKENTAFATMFPVSDVFSNVGELGLNIAVYATRISNTALNMAYGTTLDKLGLDKLVVTVIEEFKDGVFFPLLSMFIAIGVIVLFIRSFRHMNNGNTAKELVSVGMVLMFGIVVLDSPQKVVDAAEDIPAKVEQGILSIVFNDTGNGGDELCTTGNDGDLTGTNDEGRDSLSSNSVRMLLCENWRVGAFNVWAYGQWGTGSSNLEAHKMHNTNKALVRNASVKMGGGKVMSNWAVYQMDVLTSGTASFPDASKNTGATPKDFYRIVDMQAGPRNGNGTDSTYFRTWSGKEGGHRMATGLLGGLASVILSATVTTYSIAKIQLNITMLLLLALMPLMLLLGLSHEQGKRKMKAYFGTLLAIIVQRIALAALLAVIFRILFAFGNSTANGAMAMLAMAAISAVFFGLRKQVFAMISSDVVGGISGGEKQMAGANAGDIPGYITSKVQRGVRGVQAATGGVVGGFAAGGISGAEVAAKRSINHQMAFVRRVQRYRGKGEAQTFFESYSAAASEAKADLDRDPFVGDIKEAGLSESNVMKRYEKDMRAYNNFKGETQKTALGRNMKVAPDGKVLVEPIHPQLNDNKATSLLSNRRAKKVSKSAGNTKRSVVEFKNFLNKENIAIDPNSGEYMKYSGSGVESAKRIANRKRDDNWVAHIKPEDNVEARPLSAKELRMVENEYDNVIKTSEEGVEESKDIYRKQENRDYTKEEMKNALIEAREKAGKKAAEGRFF